QQTARNQGAKARGSYGKPTARWALHPARRSVVQLDTEIDDGGVAAAHDRVGDLDDAAGVGDVPAGVAQHGDAGADAEGLRLVLGGHGRGERLGDRGDADAEAGQLRARAARPRLVDRIRDRCARDVRPAHVAGGHLRGLVVVVEDEVAGQQALADPALEETGQFGVGLDLLKALVESVLAPADALVAGERRGRRAARLGAVAVGGHAVDRRPRPDAGARP